MEEKDFENNIREAFKRLERETLKAKMKAWEQDIISDEMVFENNITEASKRIERDRLKKLLQKTEQNIEPSNEKKLIIFNNRWWQYAVAACLVLGLSFYFIFQTKNNEPTLAQSTQPLKDSIVNNKIEDLNGGRDIVVRSSQNDVITTRSFNLTIKTENLGFGNTNKLKGQVIIDKTKRKTITYNYIDNKLTLTSSEALKIKSAINLDNNIYIKVKNAFYLIKPNKENQALEVISDKELIEKLEKIDFTNADN